MKRYDINGCESPDGEWCKFAEAEAENLDFYDSMKKFRNKMMRGFITINNLKKENKKLRDTLKEIINTESQYVLGTSQFVTIAKEALKDGKSC